VLQRRRTATTTPASQKKALLQAASLKHLSQNYDIAEPLDCLRSEGNVPADISPKVGAEANLTTALANRVRISHAQA